MSGGAVVLAVVVVLCAAAGTGLLVLARRRSAGSPAGAGAADARRLLGEAAGEPAEGALVLLLFSRASCPRCRETREVLTAVAGGRDDLAHREVDVDARPDLVAALGVRTTPTVVVVDATGGELLRVAGVPRREDLVAALAPHLP